MKRFQTPKRIPRIPSNLLVQIRTNPGIWLEWQQVMYDGTHSAIRHEPNSQPKCVLMCHIASPVSCNYSSRFGYWNLLNFMEFRHYLFYANILLVSELEFLSSSLELKFQILILHQQKSDWIFHSPSQAMWGIRLTTPRRYTSSISPPTRWPSPGHWRCTTLHPASSAGRRSKMRPEGEFRQLNLTNASVRAWSFHTNNS